MMKNILLLLCLLISLCTGCKQKGKSEEISSGNTVVKTEQTNHRENTGVTHSYPEMIDYYKDLLPDYEWDKSREFLAKLNEIPHIDLNESVETISYHELRLRKDLMYARKGMLLKDPNTYYYILNNYRWYGWVLETLFEEDKMITEYEDVYLTKDEKTYIEKINKRIHDLQAHQYHAVNGLNMANPSLLSNLQQFEEFDTDFMQLLQENNFAITPGKNIQLFHVYEENDYKTIPSFITTDLFLQVFHMYFSYILKSLEQQEFIPVLSKLCLEMYTQSLRIAESETTEEIKQLAEYSATFYAIPYYLLQDEKLPLPSGQQSFFNEEINNIRKQEDTTSRFLNFTNAYFPYSLFTPRGHYTRKKELTAYFQAMMWLQVASFCREDNTDLKKAVFSAWLLNGSQTSQSGTIMDLYKKIYDPTFFLVGAPDNLSIMDIALCLKAKLISSLPEALSPENMEEVDRFLQLVAQDRNRIRPQEELSCRDKINFIPQRYVPDNEILQTLVDDTPNAERAYPRGLDVFSVFGSETATHLLDHFYNESEKWSAYPAKRQELKNRLNNFPDSTLYNTWAYSTTYNMWLHSLLTLQKTDKSYPTFMQTRAWDYKNLNTGLASWAELKHDMILYAEQPMGAECGGGDWWPEPVVKGYVEPNLPFWQCLQKMTDLTKDILNKYGLMNSDIVSKTDQLKDYIQFLIKVTEKELKGIPLSNGEYTTIKYMGASIDYFTLSIIDPENSFYDWSLIQGPDKSVAVVADVYTRNFTDCGKNGILHVATGNVDYIYVVVEIEGQLYLTRGATFTYYEFVEPLNRRLTDEKWQQRLEDGYAPAIQPWMKNIRVNKGTKVNDKVFYSSGC